MAEEEAKEDAEENKTIEKIKKPNWKKIWILIFILAIIIVVVLATFFIWRWSSGKSSVQEMLDITYSVELEDATIIDSGTNNFVLGSMASFFGFNTNKLDEEIETMEIGEEKTIILESADAYGEYDENLAFVYNRTEKIERETKINRTQIILVSFFAQTFNEQPILDKEYTSLGAPWPYKVLEVNDTHVKISQEATIGTKIPAGFFTYEVIAVTENEITLKMQGEDTVIPTPSGNIEITFTNEYVIYTLTPQIGQIIELQNMPKAKVIDINDTHLFLDANPEFAGEKILVKITLNDKYTKTDITGSAVSIAGAPTMQISIVSYCPYGIQMLKGLLPVWKEFDDIANIELRFSRTQHGQKEEDENKRIICIREEQYSKLIPYLECFVLSDDPFGCMQKAGVDKSAVDDCMNNRINAYFEEEMKFSDTNKISSSPTTIINGKTVQIYPRSPQDIANVLCEAFISKPSECSQIFSTANPSPGFGGGTSEQGGEC